MEKPSYGVVCEIKGKCWVRWVGGPAVAKSRERGWPCGVMSLSPELCATSPASTALRVMRKFSDLRLRAAFETEAAAVRAIVAEWCLS